MPNSSNLSPLAYLKISVISLLIGVGILLFFVFKSEAIIKAGISEMIFYVLLIPLALSAAFSLFGALKSYAKFQGKVMGGTLELGGPCVLFCVVLIGGIKLVPGPTSPLSLTIYFEDLAGNSVNLKGSIFQLNLNSQPIEGRMIDLQSVVFSEIPETYRLQTVKLSMTPKKWVFENELNKIDIKLDTAVQVVRVKLMKGCLDFSGSVYRGSSPLKNAEISVGQLKTRTDASGRFKIEFPPHTTKSSHKLIITHPSLGTVEETINPCIRNTITLSL